MIYYEELKHRKLLQSSNYNFATLKYSFLDFKTLLFHWNRSQVMPPSVAYFSLRHQVKTSPSYTDINGLLLHHLLQGPIHLSVLLDHRAQRLVGPGNLSTTTVTLGEKIETSVGDVEASCMRYVAQLGAISCQGRWPITEPGVKRFDRIYCARHGSRPLKISQHNAS